MQFAMVDDSLEEYYRKTTYQTLAQTRQKRAQGTHTEWAKHVVGGNFENLGHSNIVLFQFERAITYM